MEQIGEVVCPSGRPSPLTDSKRGGTVQIMEGVMEHKLKLKDGGYLLLCTDPEHCDKEHNEIDVYAEDESHHYGCDCWACIEFYRSLK